MKYELKFLYSSDVFSLKIRKTGSRNPNKITLWAIWGFRRQENEIFALMEFFEAQTVSFRRFGTTHLIPENGIDRLSRNVGNYQSALGKKNPRIAKISKWCSFSHTPNKPIISSLAFSFLLLYCTGWGISRLTPLYPTYGLLAAFKMAAVAPMSRISYSFTPNH